MGQLCTIKLSCLRRFYDSRLAFAEELFARQQSKGSGSIAGTADCYHEKRHLNLPVDFTISSLLLAATCCISPAMHGRPLGQYLEIKIYFAPTLESPENMDSS